jgi:subtilisin family serine protease
MNAIAIEADDETIERIALPRCRHVEPVMWVQGTTRSMRSRTPSMPRRRSSEEFFLPGTRLDESPAVWGAGNRGEGVTIAVVDTASTVRTRAFGDRVKAFADFVGEEQNVR